MTETIQLLRQEYPGGKYVAAGLVLADECEHIYLEFGGGPQIHMRRDEAASVIWALGGALYSSLIRSLVTQKETPESNESLPSRRKRNVRLLDE